MAEILPAHWSAMQQLIGTKEAPGDADNPVILHFATEVAARFPEMRDYCALYKKDSTPWCGLAVARALALAGIRPPYDPRDDRKSFMWAHSFVDWGAPVFDPIRGDIMVFETGSGHHVTIYDRTEASRYVCIGGNQRDMICESSYSISSCVAIRRPPAPSSARTSPASSYSGITATVFGGPGDEQLLAYSDVAPGWADRPGVALPFRFKGKRPLVRVTRGTRSVVCPIFDVGPWNTADAYWQRGDRPQAEGGIDMRGRKTNLAGIDLTPATARAIGLNGKGLVAWSFVDDVAVTSPAPAKPPRTITINVDAIEALLMLLLVLAQQERRMTETTIAPAASKPDLVTALETVLPLILKLLDRSTPATPVALPPPPPVVVEAPPPAPAPKTGFGTGILGVIMAAIAHQQGVIADPVGPASTITGLLSFVLPIALSVFGAGGGIAGVLGKVLIPVIAGMAKKK